MGLDNFPMRQLTDEELASATIYEGGVKHGLLSDAEAQPGQFTVQVPNGDEPLTYGPYDSEVEAYAAIKSKTLTTNRVDPGLFENLPGQHVLGMFGGPGWIRGKVYNSLVERRTNGQFSLYEDLSPERVKELANRLEDINGMSLMDVDEFKEFTYLRAYMRVLADNGYGLAAWS